MNCKPQTLSTNLYLKAQTLNSEPQTLHTEPLILSSKPKAGSTYLVMFAVDLSIILASHVDGVTGNSSLFPNASLMTHDGTNVRT